MNDLHTISHAPERIRLMLSIPALLVMVGTVGYSWIEGWPLLDAFYMTVITLTTVGFREVHPLSPAGMVFTTVLAMVGIFMLFFAATNVIAYVVSGRVANLFGSRWMERSLAELNNHLIVCGFGRMGRLVCSEFSARGLPFVVIDRTPLEQGDFNLPHGLFVHGDATSDEVLERVGIRRARALVSVVASDADNLYITMSARLLNERLFVVARAEDERSQQKLTRAGANRVVSPYVIGGARVAQAVLRPNVVDFLELATRTEHLELNIEEARLGEKSPLAGATLESSGIRHEHGLIIVGIKKSSGHMLFNPPRDAPLEAGDILIMLGKRSDLDQVAALAQG